MKCSAALALVGLMVALPACAQHAIAHGGSSGHSGSASAPVARGPLGRGSVPRVASIPRSAAMPRFGGYRATPGRRPNFIMRPPGVPYRGPRPPYNGDGFRRPYRGPYIVNGYLGIPGYPFVSPYVFGDYDDIDTSDAADAQAQNQPYDQADNGYGYAPETGSNAAAADQSQQLPPYPNYAQAPPSPYRPPYQPQAAQPAAPAPTSEQAVTLIFKDGRPPETIHNYLLTAKTLYVGDDHRKAIPVEDLDLAATEKANQDACVNFALPKGQ